MEIYKKYKLLGVLFFAGNIISVSVFALELGSFPRNKLAILEKSLFGNNRFELPVFREPRYNIFSSYNKIQSFNYFPYGTGQIKYVKKNRIKSVTVGTYSSDRPGMSYQTRKILFSKNGSVTSHIRYGRRGEEIDKYNFVTSNTELKVSKSLINSPIVRTEAFKTRGNNLIYETNTLNIATRNKKTDISLEMDATGKITKYNRDAAKYMFKYNANGLVDIEEFTGNQHKVTYKYVYTSNGMPKEGKKIQCKNWSGSQYCRSNDNILFSYDQSKKKFTQKQTNYTIPHNRTGKRFIIHAYMFDSNNYLIEYSKIITASNASRGKPVGNNSFYKYRNGKIAQVETSNMVNKNKALIFRVDTSNRFRQTIFPSVGQYHEYFFRPNEVLDRINILNYQSDFKAYDFYKIIDTEYYY